MRRLEDVYVLDSVPKRKGTLSKVMIFYVFFSIMFRTIKK